MALIVHTADVHLSVEHPRRLQALAAVLALADQVGADAVTVGGDLFDSHDDAHRLRPDLRSRFSEASRPILVIPGNHDERAFAEELDYGANVEVLWTKPFHVRDLGDTRILGVPYQPVARDQILLALRERDAFEGPEVLLLHCSLDLPFLGQGMGEEDRYFPVSADVLAGLACRLYLAGHYHGPSKQALSHGGVFVYPGSPSSVTRRELGRRMAAVIDTGRDSVELRPLETFYYDRFLRTVLPGEEEVCLEALQAWLAERARHQVEMEIRLEGFLRMAEQEFAGLLREVTGDLPLDNRCRGMARVLEDPLFREFERRLEEADLEAGEREAVLARGLKAFARMQVGQA